MSALDRALAEYLATRRALGARLKEPGRTLPRLVDVLKRERAPFLTAEIALRWATESPGVQPATWARRLAMARGFATWLHVTDPRTEIPPRGLLNVRHRRKPPHVFSNRDVPRLMTKVLRMRWRSRLRTLTYSTLIGMLAATGLRPGEAFALDVGDVDLREGTLLVRNSKGGKSRLVPLETSTRTALAAYAQKRRQLCPAPESAAFLVAERGRRLRAETARHMFALVTRSLGLRSPGRGKPVGRGPRLQDLRHTFATQRLIEWYRAGVDVTRKMPQLSTYLGHAELESTYWYIEAVPQLLALASQRLAVKGGVR